VCTASTSAPRRTAFDFNACMDFPSLKWVSESN
jgi:hypothetical protein